MESDLLTNVVGELINSDAELREKLKAKIMDAIDEADIKACLQEGLESAIEYTMDDMDLKDCLTSPIRKYLKQTISKALGVTVSKKEKADD